MTKDPHAHPALRVLAALLLLAQTAALLLVIRGDVPGGHPGLSAGAAALGWLLLGVPLLAAQRRRATASPVRVPRL